MKEEKSVCMMENYEEKEYTKEESVILKGIAILFMIGLHLYNRDVTDGFYKPLLYIGNQPFIYYVSFMFDACVPIYCFIAGYAVYIKKNISLKKQVTRILVLLMNYWVIVLITVIIGIMFHSDQIPNSFYVFLGNVFLYKITYVGAWWFMQTYVLLFLSSKCIIKVIDKMNPLSISGIIFVIYVVSYYFRMMHPIVTVYPLINEFMNIAVLYGTSLFSYSIGILFRKYFIISKLRSYIIKNHNVFGMGMIICCFIIHSIIKSMIIAPFIAILFICGFSLLKLDEWLTKLLYFIGTHSTNIWLIHMQFYMIFFKDFIFQTNTVIGCFILLVTVCIGCSFFIKFLVKNMVKLISI